MKPETLFVRSLFAITAGAAVAIACVDTESYVYSAQKYDSANDCVQAYQSIEVIDGKGAKSTCPKTCLDVNGELFVSTMCPPLPAIATAVPLDASACKAALEAASCDEPEDGGDDGGEEEGGDAETEGGAPDGDTDSSPTDAGPDVVDASDAG